MSWLEAVLLGLIQGLTEFLPVSSSGQTVSWFGYNGDYITLQYVGMNTSSGYRYFTILTYGN